ncbi:MAG TPA: glycosyltransferase family 39 protein, partial [Kofleriaceae bacterium]|nr:glycosyltransferase family 39 protein [Kofleriaceae bacterium]
MIGASRTMPPTAAWAPDLAPARRPLRYELVFVALVALAVLAPGIWKYSLLDPWETHYGEVTRMMLQDHDFVHTQWPQDGEGFRSKPVLMFWMMAAGLSAAGVAEDGGYSGEMVASERTMLGIRLPFVVSAVCGLVLMWWMLARLVSRRLAWLGLLVVGSTPMFCLIARQAIPDMPLCASTLGALSLFVMAVEDGDRPIAPLGVLGRRRRIPIDARHVLLGLAGGFVLLQAAYYAYYFITSPQLGVRGRVLPPALWLPPLMLLLLGVSVLAKGPPGL